MSTIGFIISSLETGGAEKHTISLINELAKKDYKVVLFTIKKENNLQNLILGNIDIYCLNADKYLDIGALRKLKRLLLEKKVKLLFHVNSYSMMYGYLSTIKLNITRVGILHTTKLKNLKEKIKNIYYKKIINKMEYRIFVSSNQKEYWVNKYHIKKNNSIVIHNGIDTEVFNKEAIDEKRTEEIKRKYNLSNDDFIILNCSMLRSEKNHIQLLKTIKILIDKGCNIKALLVGEGTQRNRIEKYINKENLSNNVFLVGLQDDVRAYQIIANIGILTSNSETFSIAALEQMAIGKPMILSNIGGANEMIIHGYNGFLYGVNDSKHLEGIINYCYLNRTKINAMNQLAKSVVINTFNLSQMIEKYVEFIENVCVEEAKGI